MIQRKIRNQMIRKIILKTIKIRIKNDDTTSIESQSTSKNDNGKSQDNNGNNERTQGKQATQQNNNQQQSSNQQSQNNNGYMTQEQINEWNKINLRRTMKVKWVMVAEIMNRHVKIARKFGTIQMPM